MKKRPFIFFNGEKVQVKNLDYLRPMGKSGTIVKWHPLFKEDGNDKHYFYSVLIDGTEYLLRDDEMERI